MKRTAITLLLVLLCKSAKADYSERLVHAALADYFNRYYCNLKRPQFTREITDAFRASKLQLVPLQCEQLRCKNIEHTEGMKHLWSRAEQLTNEELSEVCASYARTLLQVELEFSDELASAATRQP